MKKIIFPLFAVSILCTALSCSDDDEKRLKIENAALKAFLAKRSAVGTSTTTVTQTQTNTVTQTRTESNTSTSTSTSTVTADRE
ncbi:MAG: hypothetical protein M9962_13940 [Oligoflexia bacterium]|nr:hypothetical protein [Oligoflexia bacterium]